jgi:hypothetical protein
LLPSLEAALILLLLLGNPSRLAKHAQRVHQVAVAFVVLLVVAAPVGDGAIDLRPDPGHRSDELAERAPCLLVVWSGSATTSPFALLYWLIDSGGPIARSRQSMPGRLRVRPAHEPGARTARLATVFLDYLHLGFTNATAFSPTDVMPLTHRAKYTMIVQSTVALALFGLIVARAVNAFTVTWAIYGRAGPCAAGDSAISMLGPPPVARTGP